MEDQDFAKIRFFKGSYDVLENKKSEERIEFLKTSFEKVLDGKNLSFLLGSGCSSFRIENEEIGIPTMKPLAKTFFEEVIIDDFKTRLKEDLGLDIDQPKFRGNLEFFLGTMHSLQFFLESTTTGQSDGGSPSFRGQLEFVKQVIKQVKDYFIEKILNEDNKVLEADAPLIEVYERFYRKLLYRSSNLPKPNIFTTNYDLYSETALDRLGIHYVNGFSGGIKKYFNPTIFNYATAERMDLSQNKWGVIDNFVYLYKIHGSVNWVQDSDGSKLFKIREIQDTTAENLKEQETVMIHPTPLKHNASLGSPYSDLFREFQKKLMQNNNILITIGYSFGDEHINNLIYQAFTIPSFRLIIIGKPEPNSEIEKLQKLDDPRIWIINGELKGGAKLHYFSGFVDNLLPDLDHDHIDDKIESAIKLLFRRNE